MPRLREKNITRWIIFLPAFAIFFNVCHYSCYCNNQSVEYEKSIELANKEYVKNSKFQAKDRIDKLVDYINFNEQFVLNGAKEEVKSIVNLAADMMSEIYYKNPQLPKEKNFRRDQSQTTWHAIF